MASVPPHLGPAAGSAAAAMSERVLAVSSDTAERVCGAAALLRITPDALIRRLLGDFYNALGGLPTDLILRIFAFLDYSTVASVVSAVSKRWAAVLQRDPAQQTSSLRQMHGIHLLDPVRGIFYYPRALKRVQMGADSAGGRLALGRKPDGTGGGAGASGLPSFSFLTVDVRTQDVRSLPWASVKHIVRQATEEEKLVYGMVRTPSLQMPESPVLMQSAMVAHNRLIYLFGGQTYEGIVVNRCFCYDPCAKRWQSLPPLRVKRASATAAVLVGKVYVLGGYGEEEQVLDSYEVFDLATNTWERPPRQWLLPSHDSLSEVSASDGVPSAAATGTPHGDRHAKNHSPHAPSAGPVDPGPFRMPDTLCGAAVVAYKDVLILVGGFRQYIAPTETAVHYSGLSSVVSTPLNASTSRTRMVPSVSTSSMEAAGAAALAEIAARRGRPSPSATSSAAEVSTLEVPAASGAVGQDSRPAPLLPLPRRPSLSLDGPSSAERSVWIFSPRLGVWWLGGPALPSPRAFGSAAVLAFPGTLGTCLCYFGGCASAEQPETAMLYIPLNEAPHRPTDKVPADLFASSSSPSLPHRSIPSDEAIMKTYFRDPHRLTWHRHLRIPLGGAFTSAAVIGKDSARSVVLSAFYPTPNIGFCHVGRLLPAETTARPEWSAQSPRPSSSAGSVTMSTSSSTATLSPVGLDGDGSEGDHAFAAGGDHAVRRLSPALLRVGGQGTVPHDASAAFSVEATPVRRDQRRDVQQLLRTAVDAASQHKPRNPQTVGDEQQWHLAPLSEVKVRDDITGRPLMDRVSWRIQALNAKTIVAIE